MSRAGDRKPAATIGMNMKLHAIVSTVSGNTRHAAADATLGELRELPSAKRVEIVKEDDGAYLYRYDATDRMIADTWHEDVDSAKRQAAFEFLLGEKDWNEG